MNVYLVEDNENAQGRILAVFADVQDAIWFAEAQDDATLVSERTLWHGQPPHSGYNK